MSRRPTTDPPTVRSPLHSHPRRAGLTPLPLPALPFSFVGRDADVARLLSLLSCHAVVAVEGAAGIGKTAVLAATASALRRRHPAVYLSTPSSPTEEEFWAHLLVNLGKPIPPGTPGQLLSHQALTALEERQTLLLADDFHQLPRAVAASVLRELRSSIETCKVIVASRTSVPFPAVPTMVLEGLSASASAALVARCTGRTARARAPRGFVHVHQLVHGHPLAIKLGARHPDVLSGGVMLRDRAEYEPDLESLLLVPLVAGLSMAQLEVMALATLAGGKLPKAVLGKLGLDARIRSELVRRHLMEAAPDGLGTPNLLGEHVLARLDRARVRELRHRLAAAFKAGYRGQPHETRWLLEAVDLFFRSGSHVEAAAVLERNRTALIERGLAREYLSRLAVMPPAVASQYVHLAIDHARLIMQFHGENALARAILERLVEDQDPTSAACAAVGLAELELTRGDRGRALTLLEEVLAVGGRALTAEHRVRALVRVGELWAEVGRRTDARRAFREALRMLALRGDRLLASEALVGLARLLETESDGLDAEKLYRQALSIQRSLCHHGLEGRTLCRLGLHHRDRGRYKEALSCFARAQTAFQLYGDRLAAAQTGVNLAEVFMEMGRYNRARPLLEANLEILRVVRAERHVASTLLKIGILELESGSLKRAASALDEALDCFVRVEDEHGMAGVQVAQATLLHRTGNRAGARVLMEGLLVEARREGSALDVADILYRLASQALEEGDLETARTRAGEAARAFDAVGRQRFAERMRALLIRVAFVAGELAVADELASEEVAEARARSDPRGLAMALTLLAEVRLDQCRVDEAFRLTTEALRLRQRSGDQRGLVASYRLLADLLIQPGASRADRVKAQRLVSRGLELAQQQGVAVERAHLHLLQGVLSLSVGRPQEALSHAEELRLTSEGLSDLGVLSLKLAQEACASLGDLDRQGRYRDAWVEQMSQRSHPRARRLFDVTARLGLDSSPSCEWRAAGRSALVSVDRALLVETHTVDLTVDRVNLRLLFRNRAPIDLAARPQVLDLLDAVASSATRRLPVARLEKRFGRNVAHVVDQLNATVASSGRPVLRVSGDGGRVELCADLRVGVIVPRSGREQRKTRTSPPAD